LDEVAKGDLYIYPLVEPSLSFRWFLIHERGKLLSPAARAFIDQVSAEMANTQQAWDELLTSA
jgi:DNA-binding transcriptional LysR family regulator